MEKPDREGGDGARRGPRPRIDLGDGVKAVSRYSHGEEHNQQPRHHEQRGSEEEQHNPGQLCNMNTDEE